MRFSTFSIATIAALGMASADLLADQKAAWTFARNGKDQIASAELASGTNLTLAYDSTYGNLTEIIDSSGLAFRLAMSADPFLHLPDNQTIVDQGSGATILNASIVYDADGQRASRGVSANNQGQGSSTTDYWYGGSLHPLVVDRDGVTYRMIGKSVVEELAGAGVNRAYLYADHLGSVRVITDDQGKVVSSLGYHGDWGQTSVAGEANAATYPSVQAFYRFQGQEQEIFPLSALGIEDTALAAWLDNIQLYHFPHRDYASGLAAFLQTDPLPSADSLYAAFAANPANFTDDTGAVSQSARTFVMVSMMWAVIYGIQVAILTPTIVIPLDVPPVYWFTVPIATSGLCTACIVHRLSRQARQADVFSAAPAAHSNEVHMDAIVNPVAIPDQEMNREPTSDIEVQVADDDFGTLRQHRIHRPRLTSRLPVINEVENEEEGFGAPTQLSIPLPQRLGAPLPVIPENGDPYASASSIDQQHRIIKPHRVSRAHPQDHDSPDDR